MSGSELPLSPLVAIRKVISAPSDAQRAKVAPAKNSGIIGMGKDAQYTPDTALHFIAHVVLPAL